jgi:hypothetical protein
MRLIIKRKSNILEPTNYFIAASRDKLKKRLTAKHR